MTEQIFLWALIFAAAVIMIVSGVVAQHVSAWKKGPRHAHHFIESGRERDIFFVAGDPIHPEDEFED